MKTLADETVTKQQLLILGESVEVSQTLLQKLYPGSGSR